MKKISKLFLSIISLALCLCSLIPFAGCAPKGEEVQSVTYYEYGYQRAYESRCEWEIIEESITLAEYENAPEESKIGNSYFSYWEDIDTDRQAFIAHADAKVGSTIYGYEGSTVRYYFKWTFKSYKLEYVRVNILDDESIEIHYKSTTMEISPKTHGYINGKLPYEITYFIN